MMKKSYLPEKNEKKKRINDDGDSSEKKPKVSATNKRKAEKVHNCICTFC